MTGFGNTTNTGSGRASPVVLVPTNFASGESSRSGSPFVVGPSSFGGVGGAGKKGFVDLENFYDSEDEEEEEDEESGEEEEESGEESEEESGSGSEESSGEEESGTENEALRLAAGRPDSGSSNH
ncbi:hypothetical protein P7C70_g8048, partial [Phenoliferia sp. Uapishka_3]